MKTQKCEEERVIEKRARLGNTIQGPSGENEELEEEEPQVLDCLEKHRSPARTKQNTGWKPTLLYAVAWLPWVRGDCARMSSRDRSTLRKAM